MSKKRKPKLGRPQKVISELDLELFKELSNDLLDLRRSGRIVFDIHPRGSIISYTPRVQDTFLDKYKISREKFSDMTEALGNALYRAMTNTEEEFLERLRDKELVERAREMFIFANEKLDVYPEIKNRFLVMLHCKTRFLEDMDWEINLKTLQPSYVSEIEKPTVFPVCVLRLMLRRPSSVRRQVGPSEPEALTMELSLDDVINLINTFSEIRDGMKKESKA